MFAHDKLPTDKNKIGDFGIINLDDSDGPGTHWVGYYIHIDNPLYFDSFGLSPDDRTIKFLRGSNPILYNDSQLQDFDSDRCGWFVAKWLVSMLGGISFYDSLYDKFVQIPSPSNEKLVKPS